MSSRNDRRSGSGRDDRKDDRRGGRDRDESKSRRDHGSSGGGRSNGADQRNQSYNTGGSATGGASGGGGGSQMHHGGGGQQRGALSFSGAPLTENELMNDLPKKKFTGRCRLFVGNLPNEVKEAELKELFSPHGDIAECYLSGKGFAFLRLDTRAHAESAKEAIDGRVIHGRQVRVRFAVHGAALRVKELSPTVSNEMLYHAFSHFGEVERAVHIVDEKGRPTGEGIVEFERKPSCNEAIAAIREKVFLLTASPKPLIVELLEPRDEDDGLAERMIPRTPQLTKERELGPRFPTQSTFEFVYGKKWKELYEMEKQRRYQLEEDLKEARRRLEQDMELAYQDYQAQMLREDLQRRQMELDRLEAARRERLGRVGAQGGPFGAPMGAPPSSMNMYGGYNQGAPMNPYGGPGGPMGVPPPMGGSQGGPMGGPGGPPMIYKQESGNVYKQEQLNAPGGPMGAGFNQPPPQQANQAANQGPGGGRPQSGSNMSEGIQRLLQIFRNEPNSVNPQRAAGGPQPGMGGSYNQQNEFPPEKRLRR